MNNVQTSAHLLPREAHADTRTRTLDNSYSYYFTLSARRALAFPHSCPTFSTLNSHLRQILFLLLRILVSALATRTICLLSACPQSHSFMCVSRACVDRSFYQRAIHCVNLRTSDTRTVASGHRCITCSSSRAKARGLPAGVHSTRSESALESHSVTSSCRLSLTV